MPSASSQTSGQPPAGHQPSADRTRSRCRAGLLASATIAAAAVATVGTAIPAGAATRITPATAQPSNFTIGKPAAYYGTAVLAANGTAYLPYTAYTSTARTKTSAWVCVLPRGARKCKTTTLLRPLDSSTSVSNQPASVVLGRGGTVDVLVTTNSDSNNDDLTGGGQKADTLEYVLTASGKLTSVTRVGTLNQQGTAINFDGQLLWTSGGERPR
jgi:hypothetical protein